VEDGPRNGLFFHPASKKFLQVSRYKILAFLIRILTSSYYKIVKQNGENSALMGTKNELLCITITGQAEENSEINH
jgi:hypothetical protein